MNLPIIKSYIEEYKRNFRQVHDQEIYKWKAIKQFRDHFDIEAPDFYDNLNQSLSKAGNLLASGQYYPKRMLLRNAAQTPEPIRDLFKALYREDLDLLKRIENFQADFQEINSANFGNLSHYQDHRAIMVYLTLNYPERYFFYKFQMFKDFTDNVAFTYKPKRGRIENISQFHHLCELIRYEIAEDQELLKLHENRLDSDCYRDINHHVLTQDFIYAVVKHLNKPATIQKAKPKQTLVEETLVIDLSLKKETVDFTPRVINHIQNSLNHKRIGDLGEVWVLKREVEYLKKNGKPQLANQVKHVAKDQGDGLGYDILSFDLNGYEKYIEVKTTQGNVNSTFYITRNELECSKRKKDNYFLYRVYNYHEHTETADLLMVRGELTSICQVPINYQVMLEEPK